MVIAHIDAAPLGEPVPAESLRDDEKPGKAMAPEALCKARRWARPHRTRRCKCAPLMLPEVISAEAVMARISVAVLISPQAAQLRPRPRQGGC